MTIPNTIASVLATATTQLADHQESPRLEAEILLAHALGQPRTYLYAWPERYLVCDILGPFKGWLQRRISGEPLAYIIGQWEFWSLNLTVTPDTLIPRPETELLVEKALEKIPTDVELTIADLGTGSGAIALALAKERPRCMITATDISTEALEIAQKNAHSLGLNSISFKAGDWLNPLHGMSFDLIISNPPYVASHDPHLRHDDPKYEPRQALHAGPDGLEAIEKIVAQAKNHLNPSGWLLLEHGYDQGESVVALLGSYEYHNIYDHHDYGHQPRVIVAQKSKE